MADPLRILLADDHVLLRKGMRSLIAGWSDMVVVGEASDGLQAIELARTTAPDIVLLDINMPRCSGLEALPQILRDAPQARVVMLTVSDDEQDLFTAIKRGAFGYLLKSMEPQQLFDLLDGVRRGEAPIAGAMATKMLDEFRLAASSHAPAPGVLDALTAREAAVLKRVANGMTNRQVADALSITENTVKVHLRHILEKLHLQNRIQASAYAIRQGLAAAQAAGLTPLKINMVVLRGLNDDEVPKMARLTLDHPWHVRFIEVMPMAGASDRGDMLPEVNARLITTAEIQQRLQALGTLVPDGGPRGHGPARYYRLPNAQGTIGFISPISDHFCACCNRLRLTADGYLYSCLLSDQGIFCRAALADGESLSMLQSLIRRAAKGKPQQRPSSTETMMRGAAMSAIGG